jgi:hypothetical protein
MRCATAEGGLSMARGSRFRRQLQAQRDTTERERTERFSRLHEEATARGQGLPLEEWHAMTQVPGLSPEQQRLVSAIIARETRRIKTLVAQSLAPLRKDVDDYRLDVSILRDRVTGVVEEIDRQDREAEINSLLSEPAAEEADEEEDDDDDDDEDHDPAPN